MSIAARRVARAPDQPYGPLSYANVALALAYLHAPAGASYVTWNDAWPNDIEYVMANYLTTNDILVLPERTTPYYVHTANGFTYPTSTVKSWSDGALLVNNSRTWGEMTRVRRGIIGLGPGAVVALQPSSFTQIAQGGPTERYYLNASGTQVYENGCMEKIIGCAHTSAYFGNFTLAPSLDFGGVAYTCIGWDPGTTSASAIFERLRFQGSHRGFAGVPNGETGAIGVNKGTYTVYNCEIDCRLPDTTSVGTSPIMINSSLGGLMKDSYFHHSLYGMPTHWNCGGTHTMRNVRSETMLNGPGWNLEYNKAGAEFDFIGGDFVLGGKKFQISIGGYGSSAKINCQGVVFNPSQGWWPGYFSINTYGNEGVNNQTAEDITIIDSQGNAVPTRISLASGTVTK